MSEDIFGNIVFQDGCWFLGGKADIETARNTMYNLAHSAKFALPEGYHAVKRCNQEWCVNPLHLQKRKIKKIRTYRNDNPLSNNDVFLATAAAYRERHKPKKRVYKNDNINARVEAFRALEEDQKSEFLPFEK